MQCLFELGNFALDGGFHIFNLLIDLCLDLALDIGLLILYLLCDVILHGCNLHVDFAADGLFLFFGGLLRSILHMRLDIGGHRGSHRFFDRCGDRRI